MIAFHVIFQPGVPIYQQVVYAAKKALISGQIRPGDRFPSVRALSQELKINPNTAHKVISQLVAEGMLDVHPGLGTVAANLPASTAKERSQLLRGELEALVVDAMKLQLGLDDLKDALTDHWVRLTPSLPAHRPSSSKGEKQ